MTVVPKAPAGEMQDDECRHDHTDNSKEDLDSQRKGIGGRFGVTNGKRGSAERLCPLQDFTPLLLLLASAIGSSAPRLVNPESRDHKQHQHGATSIPHELDPQAPDFGEPSWRSR